MRETDKKQVDLLKHEYAFLVDYLKYNYDERDKYIKFFMAAIGAVGAVIGLAIKEGGYCELILILSLLTAGLSYLVFRKVLFQRVVVTKYKNHLNMIRGELWKRAGNDDEINLAILSVKPDVEYNKSGGDFSVLRIIETITATSTAAGLFLMIGMFDDIQQRYLWVGCTSALLIFILTFGLLEYCRYRILRKEDNEREKLMTRLQNTD